MHNSRNNINQNTSVINQNQNQDIGFNKIMKSFIIIHNNNFNKNYNHKNQNNQEKSSKDN